MGSVAEPEASDTEERPADAAEERAGSDEAPDQVPADEPGAEPAEASDESPEQDQPAKPRDWRRTTLTAVAAVLVLVVAFVAVQLLRPLPATTVHVTTAGDRTVPGAAPRLPWPKDGQAALEVEGVGSFGSVGSVNTPVPIASVTKVMTAYVILRDHPLKAGQEGPTLTVSAQEAAAEKRRTAGGQSTVAVVAGEKLSERTALKALLIPSGNNIAILLARWDAGSTAAFEQKMNATARRLGMTNTHYTDPSGFESSTMSTATDLVRLARRAMTLPTFAKIVGTTELSLPHNPELHNTNGLLTRDGVVGIKTGTTSAAGGCLMFAAERKVAGAERLIVGVVLGQSRTPILGSVLDASRRLVVGAEHALGEVTAVPAGTEVGYLDNGFGARTPIVTGRRLTAAGWPGLGLRLRATGIDAPSHDADSGARVGTLRVRGQAANGVPLRLRGGVRQPSLVDRLFRF